MGGGPPVVGGGGGGRTEKGSRLKWQLGGGGEGNGAARGGEGDGEERDSPWAWCWSGRRERQPHSTCTRGRLRGGGSSATGRTVGKACETDLGASCKRRSIRPATRAAGRRQPYHLLRPLSVAGHHPECPPAPATHPPLPPLPGTPQHPPSGLSIHLSPPLR